MWGSKPLRRFLQVIKKASTALFPQHGCLCFPPKLPGPGLSTPCKLTRVMALPRPALALWVGHGVWRGGKGLRERKKQALALSIHSVWKVRQKLWPRGGPHRLFRHENSPEAVVCLVSHAWLSSLCSRSLPATLPTLASPAQPLNRPGPISLILDGLFFPAFTNKNPLLFGHSSGL